ncbi:MAG: aspartoacylase [Sulfurovaceae bacterium]|nr:aspartoacylase [Sulfurovaceae bacterium]
MREKIDKVFIVGGTHGNEQIGAFLVENLSKELVKNQYAFSVETLIGNPKAVRRKIRYIDADLNRLFKTEELENLDKSTYEHERARVLNNIIGPKGDNSNFLIDLHTTNANMGITIMTPQRSPFKLNMLNYIAQRVENVNIYFSKVMPDRPSLNSVTKGNFLIEVGPVANNTLKSDVYFAMKKLVYYALEFLDKYVVGALELDMELEVEGYQSAGPIPYPRDEEGNLLGMIHPNIQGEDLKKVIKKGDPIFKLFTGEDVLFDREGEYLMAFINESAYYVENVAFYLIDKVKVKC